MQQMKVIQIGITLYQGVHLFTKETMILEQNLVEIILELYIVMLIED